MELKFEIRLDTCILDITTNPKVFRILTFQFGYHIFMINFSVSISVKVPCGKAHIFESNVDPN